jgi:hypothetical protein
MAYSIENYQNSILLARYLGYRISTEKTDKGYIYRIGSTYLQESIRYGSIVPDENDGTVIDYLWSNLMETSCKISDWRYLILLYSTYKKYNSNGSAYEYTQLENFKEAVGENYTGKAFIAMAILIARLKNDNDDWDALGK